MKNELHNGYKNAPGQGKSRKYYSDKFNGEKAPLLIQDDVCWFISRDGVFFVTTPLSTEIIITTIMLIDDENY